MRLPVFLELLAERLNEIAPRGFSVHFQGGLLWFSGGQGVAGSALAVAHEAFVDFVRSAESQVHKSDRDPRYEPLTSEEVIAALAFKAMDEFQDYVAEQSRTAWPDTQNIARPCAIVEGGLLQMWYGERVSPKLVVSPINVGERLCG